MKNKHLKQYRNNSNHTAKQSNKPMPDVETKPSPTLALSLFIVCSIPVLLYLQTITFSFTHFDDDTIITANISFLSDYKNIPQAFTTDAFMGKHGTFYRPLQTISYMVDAHFSSEQHAWMFHLTNLLFLGLIAIMLFLLLRRLLIPAQLALLGTLFYCTNPLFVSSIAWIPARGDMMLTFFALLSFLLFVIYLSEHKRIFLFAHWIAFTAALFCKETAALLPILYISYYFIFITPKQFDKKKLLLLFLYAIPVILWFWLRSQTAVPYSKENELGVASFVANIPSVFESLSKFIIPLDFAPIPAYSLLKILLGIAIAAGIVFITFKSKERPLKEKLFCITWFMLLIVPPMVYKHPLIDYLDHRFLLPLFGILFLLLFIVPKSWMTSNAIKKPWIIIAVIVIFSTITFIKSRAYANPLSFYNQAIAQNPQSSLSYNNRGRIKNDAGDNLGAIDDYNHALTINPNNELAYYNRGLVKTSINNIPEAIADFNHAILLNPNNANAYFGRGTAYNAAHHFKEAIDDFTKTIELNAKYGQAYNNRGSARSSLGDKQGAIDDYTKAITIFPDYAEAYYNRGNAKSDIQDYAGAVTDFTLAIGYKPNYEDAYNNKGIALVSMDKYQEALQTFDKAIAINPQSFEAYGNRAITKNAMHDYLGVIADCNMVLQLKPNDGVASNLKAIAEQKAHELYH